MRSMAGFKQDGMGDYYLPREMAEELGCEAYFHDQIDKSGILERFRSGQQQVIVVMSAWEWVSSFLGSTEIHPSLGGPLDFFFGV